jgi:prepilin-type processing-associated H-X9-DG protein
MCDAKGRTVFFRAEAVPPDDLTGYDRYSDNSNILMPRHGNRPRRIPKDHPVSAPLPGAINMVFFDGHAQLVPLEKLWGLQWDDDYVPPAKRPGLE